MVEPNPEKAAAGRRNEIMLDGRPIHGVYFAHFDEWKAPTDGAALLCTHLNHLTTSLPNGVVK